MRELLERSAYLERYATMIDASAASYANLDGIDRPILIDATMVNEIIGSPGSRIAYEFNFRLLEGILPGKADVTSAALAVTLAASMGQVERAVVVGTPDWHKVVGKMNFKLVAGLGDTFDRSRVMKNLKPRNFGVANRLLSRAATVRYIRYHTLGGYATTKATDQVYAQSLDAVAVADKPQEKKDSIVTRSLALLGLNPKVQTDLDAYYLFAKSLDPLATVYAQIAQEAKSGQQLTLSEFSAGGSSMQDILKAHAGGEKQQVKLVKIYPVPEDESHRGHVLCTAWVASRVDRSCLPRRAGGPALLRGGVRAYERALELTPLGVPIVVGLVAEITSLRNLLGALIPRAHLAHPALDRILPPQVKGLNAMARNAVAKRLFTGVNAVYAAFEEARTGTPTEIQSDRKALRSANCKQLVEAARAYGAFFKAPGEEVAKKVLKAVTLGIGAITADSTEAETKLALEKSVAVFLFGDDEGKEVLEKADFEFRERPFTDAVLAEQTLPITFDVDKSTPIDSLDFTRVHARTSWRPSKDQLCPCR